ncbi:mechanosensitive ion channel family protein [Cyanobium sp. ATX 6F1]|uniref:mechanosensitive ion channel family protein n=1 Tax=Cyanobium sp. ATX 6F1 TaxID=2823702 RepID=UPI0028F44EE2|nr:mechanosensitive ion channel domain-containing protein [Cyanobium sp. ATX 6F1]MCP9916595.1 mechanosensitive ion channel family protein [Cyanobium sp. ATX 6F1]
MSHSRRFGWGRRLRQLLAALLAAALAVAVVAALPTALGGAAPGNPAAAVGPPAGFVELEGRRVLEIRAAVGVQTPVEMARRGNRRLAALAADYSVDPAQLVIREDPPYTSIGLLRNGEFDPQIAVDDRNAARFGLSRQQLAERYLGQIRGAIERYRRTHRRQDWIRGTALALLALGLYILWLRGQIALNRRLKRWIADPANRRLQGLHVGGNQWLTADQLRGLLDPLRRIVHGAVLLLVSYLSIPLFLGLFPPTQALSQTLTGQIRALVVGGFASLVRAIPDLISVAVILGLSVLLMRASNAWFKAVELGNLRLRWFYPEWARPTARLVGIGILLLGAVLAYPYIPGANSKAFQGAGLFVGVLAALGSSAVAANLIGGLMLTYTRAYQEGDRVSINGTVGIVHDSALLVTRLRTPRNEVVSIPNATVLGASIVNYSLARREIDEPVVIATTVTIGYDVPWRQVHQLMLAAAAATAGISQEVPPFVLQTSLNDFHISYELNAYVADVETYRRSLSDLLGAIQDQFAAAGVEILSPGYHAMRNGNGSTVPPWPAQPFGEAPPG